MNNNINNETKKHGKYYVIKTKALAGTLEWITGQRPYVFKDRDDETKIIYSFLYDDDFKGALDMLYQARNKFRKVSE